MEVDDEATDLKINKEEKSLGFKVKTRKQMVPSRKSFEILESENKKFLSNVTHKLICR